MSTSDNFERYFYGFNDIFVLGIGLEFPLKRNRTGEGTKMEIIGNNVFICLYFPSPIKKEIELINEGNITLFFSYLQPILECCVNVDGRFLGDMPFYAPIYGEAYEDELEFEFDPKLFYLCLIDADNNILKAIREIEVTPIASKYLSFVQNDQFKNKISIDGYEYLLNEIYNNASIEEIASMFSYRINIDSKNSVSESVNPQAIGFSFIK